VLPDQNVTLNTVVIGKNSCRFAESRSRLTCHSASRAPEFCLARIFSPYFCMHYHRFVFLFWTRDSSVSLVTCWTVWGSNPGRGKVFISSPKRPNRLWGRSSRCTRVSFRGGESGKGVKLATHFHLVLSLGMSGDIPLFPHIPSWCGRGNFTFTFRPSVGNSANSNTLLTQVMPSSAQHLAELVYIKRHLNIKG
jgi:hypothetical protein